MRLPVFLHPEPPRQAWGSVELKRFCGTRRRQNTQEEYSMGEVLKAADVEKLLRKLGL